jgi:multidrug efflux system outer membrane protein
MMRASHVGTCQRPQRIRSTRQALFVLGLLHALMLARCGVAVGQAVEGAAAVSDKEARPTVALTLPKALELATEHNRRLTLAGLAVADSEQKKNIAKSDYFPHIKNESTALNVTALEGVVIPAGALSQGSSGGPIPTETLNIGQGASSTYTSGTGLIQPITQLFKVHAGVRVAEADTQIARLNATDATDSIALLVHKLYYEILTRQMELAAADESVKAGQVEEAESTQAVADGKSLDVARLASRASLLQQEQASLSAQVAINDLMMRWEITWLCHRNKKRSVC